MDTTQWRLVQMLTTSELFLWFDMEVLPHYSSLLQPFTTIKSIFFANCVVSVGKPVAWIYLGRVDISN